MPVNWTRLFSIDLMKPKQNVNLIKYQFTKRDMNAGYKVHAGGSDELLARFDRKTWFNLDTVLYNYKVEIRKGGKLNTYYTIRIGNSIIRLEFNKFRRPSFMLGDKKFKWEFRKFFFFKTPMKLYHGTTIVAKYSIAVFPVKKIGVLKLYKTCSDFEKALIIASALCIVHYDSKK